MLSTAPCHPAPGRRLLIIRNDIHPAPRSAYLSFDGMLAASSAAQPTAYERNHSLSTLSPDTVPPRGRNTARSSSPSKRRWDLLKSLIPFMGPSTESLKLHTQNNQPDSGRTPRSSIDHVRPGSSSAKHESQLRSEHQITHGTPPMDSRSQYQIHSFRFSLEWLDRPAASMKERRLQPPRLPQFTQAFVESKVGIIKDLDTFTPTSIAICSSKYSGRALAEWALVVTECQNFFERRKQEGAPGYKSVETPTLGVDAFRKAG